MRAFIAIELPDKIKEELSQLQSDLKSIGADVNWVKPDNLHLTLKFLGQIKESQISTLKDTLTKSISPLSRFTFRLEGLGAFPKMDHPRIIWVGVDQGKEKLVELAEKVEQACDPLGVQKEERPFSVHLTIGRVRSNRFLAELAKHLEKNSFRAGGPVEVTEIILFQSVLSPAGPIYTPVAEISLG